MLTFFSRAWFLFFHDEAAFTRWMRAAGAGVAMILITVIPFSGTDVGQALVVVKSWTLGDWIGRLALGFLFSSVRGGSAPSEPAKSASEPQP